MSSGSAAHGPVDIDGTPVSVPVGTTIFDAARTNGIAIPTLCHQQNERIRWACAVFVSSMSVSASMQRPVFAG